MIHQSETTLLHNLLRRESRSLLQYVGEAFPWIRSQEQESLAQLMRIIDEERTALGRLAQLVVRKTLRPPYLGNYPITFTSLGFVSFDHLLPMLIENQSRDLIELERDLSSLTDAHLHERVAQLLEMKRRHLETLQSLQALAHAPAVH